MKQQAVTPYGSRVWLGYRHSNLLNKREKFVQQLGDIFIPQTVQQMGPLGLCAYFPMVLPDSDIQWPDEVALVVYPSPSIYTSATKDTTAGRAYGALHGSYFNFSSNAEIPRSRSSFPSSYSIALTTGTPYAVLGNAIDWTTGATSVLVLKRPATLRPSEFLTTLNAIISSPASATDELIIQVEADFALLYEHVHSLQQSSATIKRVLAQLPDAQALHSGALKTRVPEVFTLPDQGLPVTEGQLLDVRVE